MGPVSAEETTRSEQEPKGAAAAGATAQAGKKTERESTSKPNPYALPDGTWISIGGTVKTVTPDTFTLDYGTSVITVEMDDGDRDADAYKLIEGDEATVHGRIDDDFFQTTRIEAASVYVKKLGTCFFASAIDEEAPSLFTITNPLLTTSTVVQGVVTQLHDDEFVVDAGPRALTVEVEEMDYDLLDDEGYQKIRVGDVVRVHGTIDRDLFEGRELVADSVLKLL